MRAKGARDAVARLARAIRGVRGLTVETRCAVAVGPVRPVATTVLGWDGSLGDAVADGASALPQVLSEEAHDADPALCALHGENVAAAAAHWLRMGGLVVRDARHVESPRG